MYTLAPLRQELSVCLSCKVLLAARISQATSNRRAFASRALHQYATASESSSSHGGKTRSNYGHRKLRNLRNREVTLGVDALGEPAQIRIVGDRPEFSKRKTTRAGETREENSETSPESLRRSIAAEESEQDPESVQKNIESVRTNCLIAKDRNGGELSTVDCAITAKHLLGGFTKQQLNSYCQAPRASEASPDDFEAYQELPVLKHSRWFAGTSEFPKTAQRRLHRLQERFLIDPNKLAGPYNDHEVATQKRMIVEKIMRTLWKIRPSEEKRLGELDIRVDSAVLQVLLKNYEDVFESRARNFNVKIAVSQELDIVRLSGEYDLVKDAYNLIRASAESVTSIKLDISPQALSSSPLAGEQLASALSDVQELTGTSLSMKEVSKDGRKTYSQLEVRYIGHDKSALRDAKRLVNQVLGTDNVPFERSIVSDPPKAEGRVEVPVTPTSLLPLQERYLEWQRHRTRGPIDSGKRSESIGNHLIRPTAEGGMQGQNLEPDTASTSSTSASWAVEGSTAVMARLGYLAHKAPEATSDGKIRTKKRKAPKDDKAYRALLTNFPGQVELLEKVCDERPTMAEEFVIILHQEALEKHRGRVSRDLVGGRPASKLRLHVNIDRTEQQVKLDRVVLVREEAIGDVPMPGRGADVRFSSEQGYEARAPFDPALMSFFKASRLDVWGAGKLQTPPEITLQLPCRISAPSARGDDDGVRRDRHNEGVAEHVLFRFAHLEHRSRMSMSFEGHRVHYTTVEGGAARGRRDELSMEMKQVPEDEAGQDKRAAYLAAFDRFYEAAARLVDMIPQ